jgi:hypothetical protein
MKATRFNATRFNRENPGNNFIEGIVEAVRRWPGRYPTAKQAYWIDRIVDDEQGGLLHLNTALTAFA